MYLEIRSTGFSTSATLAFVGAIAISLTEIAGCGGAQPSTVVPPISNPSSTSTVYVVEHPSAGPSSILQFAGNANGAVSPTSTLTLPTGMLPSAIAADTAGQVYAAGINTIGTTLSSGELGEVLIYSTGASGTPVPARTLYASGSTGYGGLFEPLSLAVDSADNLYVGGINGVAVFSPTAAGQATPSRFISGALTQIVLAEDIAVDEAGFIYVANQGTNGESILVFASTATGNVAPVRSIIYPNSAGVMLFGGMATDLAGNLYWETYSGVGSFQIVEFAGGAAGASTPLRTISGTNTGLVLPGGLQVDSAGDIYAIGVTAPGTPNVSVFAASASGNVAPKSTFTSAAWGSLSTLGLLGVR